MLIWFFTYSFDWVHNFQFFGVLFVNYFCTNQLWCYGTLHTNEDQMCQIASWHVECLQSVTFVNGYWTREDPVRTLVKIQKEAVSIDRDSGLTWVWLCISFLHQSESSEAFGQSRLGNMRIKYEWFLHIGQLHMQIISRPCPFWMRTSLWILHRPPIPKEKENTRNLPTNSNSTRAK